MTALFLYGGDFTDLETSVQFVKGVGTARAAAFSKVGVTKLGDLITYYPIRYEDRSLIKKLTEILPGESCSVIASVVTTPNVSRIRKGMELLKFNVSDGGGMCAVTFFNQSYYKSRFQKGKTYLFYGKFEGNFLRHSLTSPYFEDVDENEERTGSPIVPVYPLTKGLTQKTVSACVSAALNASDGLLADALGEIIIRENNLLSYGEAIKFIHNPPDMAHADMAKKRLVFDELLTLQLGMCMLKGRSRASTGAPCTKAVNMDNFYNSVGFPLTGAQKRCIEEGIADFKGREPMNRLVQGDVGSGKTIVASALCFYAVKNGYQCAFMAPTEILATQHAENLSKLFTPMGISCALLTGSTKKSERKEMLAALEKGNIDILIATHAVLEDSVVFSKLGFIVCDEQHRFGVKQRAKMSLKGERAHTLVMSATPIPRTLALMMYGDLDISVIDELPPGRVPTVTHLASEKQRGQINAFIKKKLADGRQGYIICPLVEESEMTDGLKDVKSYAANLQTMFPDAGISFIHGKLKSAEKEEQMRLFVTGQTRLLVATTVIEVGVDVRNATFMIIENAERFGLSQLHQLRGRVGRGDEKSYCIAVTGSTDGDTTARLKVFESTTDGFVIAKEDLKLRGPGDFFGERQHGLPVLKIADSIGDTITMHAAQEAALKIYKSDPTLKDNANLMLRDNVSKLFAMDKGNFLN